MWVALTPQLRPLRRSVAPWPCIQHGPCRPVSTSYGPCDLLSSTFTRSRGGNPQVIPHGAVCRPKASACPRQGPGLSGPSPTSPLRVAAQGTRVPVLLLAAGEAVPAQLLTAAGGDAFTLHVPHRNHLSQRRPACPQAARGPGGGPFSLLSPKGPSLTHPPCSARKGPLRASLLLSPQVHLQTHLLQGGCHGLPPPTPAAPAAQHPLGRCCPLRRNPSALADTSQWERLPQERQQQVRTLCLRLDCGCPGSGGHASRPSVSSAQPPACLLCWAGCPLCLAGRPPVTPSRGGLRRVCWLR